MIFKRKKESAEELLRTETGFVRYLPPYENMLVSFIAVSWAVYQLALASVLIIDSTQQRTIHLAFAMSLLFLVNPCLKRSRKYLHSPQHYQVVPAASSIGCFPVYYYSKK